MNVLSLFDGMSCGQIALNKLGINYENYFASEIKPHAMAVTQSNFPNTHQVGDVTKLSANNLPNIDLLIGGSPCQDFSRANRVQKGADGEKSGLFWEYVRLLKELKPKYFLLENVRMKKEWQDLISEELGVQPIRINSSLVSGVLRDRFYWTKKELI
jgi:DNA-cytosine methyltransferase